MIKKIFVLSLSILFLLTNFALAKKKNPAPEISPEDRVKIAVEVSDKTTFQELDTAEILRGIICEQLADKKIFNLVGYEVPAEKFSDLKTLGEKKSASDVGELLYFNPAELTYGAGVDANLVQENYSGVDYLVKCQIVSLGTASKESDLIGFDPGFGVGIGRHSRFGFGMFGALGLKTKKIIYCTAMNVQFIKIDTNVVLWQRNLVGQAIRHKKPSKGFDDASDEAYLKSLKDAADFISKRVENYSTNFLIPKTETEDKNKTAEKSK